MKKGSFLYNLFRNFKTHRELWLICVPIIAWVAVFSYYPMYGILMAFFNYIPGKPILQCEFVGLQHFQSFVFNPIFGQLLRNTLVMSILGLTVGFVIPIIFALLLNELHFVRFKKTIQTISYLPHFISWVVAGSMIYMVLSNEGIVNQLLQNFGLVETPIPFLATGKYYWAIYTIANIWKGMGWSAIIYLSSIAGVDTELFEAGAIDGMGRFAITRYIILPTILPTIVLLWILGIGGILNAGFDQHLILGNPSTQNYWDVIDTYVYRYGVQQGYYSIGTAVSLMKSLIGFALVYLTNRITKKTMDMSIF